MSQKSERLIIDNRSKLPMGTALRCVAMVVDGGKVSKATIDGKEREIYCWVTAWKGKCVVYTVPNKKSTRFLVMPEDSGGE